MTRIGTVNASGAASRFLLLAALWASCLAGVMAATPARAQQELSLGVYLPQASFATNAERSAWAERLAADLTLKAGGAFSVRAQVFARREDAVAFSSRVDLLVADGLFALTLPGEALAHASSSPAVALFGLEVANVGALEGKVVGAAEVGTSEAAYYSNTALGGELAADRFFSELRPFKDSQTALNAVKSRSIAAAFAPADHPAAAGLTVLARGGSYPLAALVVMNPARVKPLETAIKAAVTGLAVGPLGTFAAGGGSALAQARTSRGSPRVLASPALLTGGASERPVAPPIRLQARSRPPGLDLAPAALTPATLTEPP